MGKGTMGILSTGRVRRVWDGLVVATRTRRAATCPQQAPRSAPTGHPGPWAARVPDPPPQRHPRLCGCAAPPPGPAGAGWHALASSASTPRPAHTAALARVCTPPQLWLASASPGPVPVCAAPSPPPTPAGVCGLAQPPCRRGPHSRTGWDVAGVRLARAVGDDPAAQAGAGHGQPPQPVLATEARPPPPRPPQRRHGRTQPGRRPRPGGLGRPAPPPLQPPPQLPP